MVDIPGLGKVKDSDPEVFVFALLDVERGTVKKTVFMSESEVRAWLAEQNHNEGEIGLIVDGARKREV